jgi:predicted nuclease of restriction endonuclease-like (RecB) superfamily
MPNPNSNMTSTAQYLRWIKQLKQHIADKKLQTALQVNTGMLVTYWYLGQQIFDKIDRQGWGAKVVEQLSADLQNAFPDKQGFSVRSLLYMKQFAMAYPELLITQQPAAQLQDVSENTFTQQPAAQFGKIKYYVSNALLVSIPWGHHQLLLDKLSDNEARFWYMEKCLENNWSRTVLQYQLDTDLFARSVVRKKSNNFDRTLPKPQGELAMEIFKDPYKFSFLQLGSKVSEFELEQSLIHHIQEFLIELGAGFAFIGRQVKLKAGRKEYFTDLLFYHIYLRCFIVIDLKADEFEMEHAGKMNGYLNMVNKQYKQAHDNPTIGIILCGKKDDIEVDFALQGVQQPIGVSQYHYVKVLPKPYRNQIPDAKHLQAEVKKFIRKAKRQSKPKS